MEFCSLAASSGSHVALSQHQTAEFVVVAGEAVVR